jgi:hypothetical protein
MLPEENDWQGAEENKRLGMIQGAVRFYMLI